MTAEREAGETSNTRLDYLIAAFRAVVGVVPFGSLVAEAVGAVIPRQRIDRIADVVDRVGVKLDELGVAMDQIDERFRSPEFTDILEDVMLQAGHAMSEERREHLANILLNGLTERVMKHQQIKKLVSVLNDVSDPEVIILRYASLAGRPAKTAFFALHEDVLYEPAMNMKSSAEVREKRAIQEAWRRRLVELGLTTNEQWPSSSDVTALGYMLLRYIVTPHDGSTV